MAKLFVAGNPSLPDDSLAIRIAKELEKELKTDFELLEEPLKLLEIREPVIILDIAKGISEPLWIHASDKKLMCERKMTTLHDFDLQFVLNMGSRLNEIPDIWVLAIPADSSFREIIPKVRDALRASPIPLPGSGWRRRSRGHRRG